MAEKQAAFGAEDRVPANSPPPAQNPNAGLPAELANMTPAEIVAYYQRREQDFQAQLDARQAAPPVKAPSSDDFWSDPVKATDAQIAAKSVSREEFNQMTAAAQSNLMQSARLICKDRHKDFERFEDDIMKLVNQLQPFQRVDPMIWETAYTQVLGMRSQQLIAEAEARGRQLAGGNGVESSSPAATEPAAPVPLTGIQLQVANGLGQSAEKYRKGIERMEKNEWPITLSNIDRR